MMPFDAIIVGARVAGTATAWALARLGWNVALVERKGLALGETLSLPIIHPRGLARLRDLDLFPVIEGVMPRLKRVQSLYLQVGDDLVLQEQIPGYAGFDYGVIVRREVLDQALLDYVLAASGTIRFFDANVDRLLMSETTGQVQGLLARTREGTTLELHAPLVIGADGRFSLVARQAQAHKYRGRTSSMFLFYAYCRNLDLTGLADVTFLRAPNQRLVVFSEIGEGMQVISVWFPGTQFEQFRARGHAEMRATWQQLPAMQERTRALELVGKTMGLSPAGADGYFRPMGGPGWALVGDARHYKDPSSGQGIHDALFSVQELVRAIKKTSGGVPFSAQIAQESWPRQAAEVGAQADQALLPLYNFTYTFADGLARSPTLLERAMLRTIARSPAKTRHFFGVLSGATPIQAFQRAAPGYILRGLFQSMRPGAT